MVRRPSKTALPELTLSVQYPGGKLDAPTRAQIRRWVRKSCDHPAEIVVRLVDEAEGKDLNRDYRGKDYATNVLSFSYSAVPLLAGDLILCLPVVRREAVEQNKPAEAHFAHLVVHGMLHLQGFNHETDPDEAARMEAQERDILAALGFSDPYL
jgi:probable rRNA maturation factor